MSAASPRRSREARDFATGGHLPEAVYVYESQAGDAVGAVVRFAPGTLKPDKKSFVQYRWEAGRWQVGLNGLTLPLYRAAELLSAKAGGRTVFLVEGEKCVEALRRAGEIATTNAGGSGQWLPEHAQTLAGFHVAVLGDNDQPGRKHATAVATNLIGIAASVRLVPTPGATERPADDGWDIADWLAAGGTAELLSGIAASTPEFVAAQTGATDWAATTPLGDSEEPEPFPLDQALPPALAEFARAVSEAVMIDPTAPAAILPAILSIAAGNAFNVRVSDAYVEPNLSRYVFYSKPSGERGSELFRHLERPLNKWMNDQQPQYGRLCDAATADAQLYTKRAEKIESKAATESDAVKFEFLRQEAAAARASIPKPPRRPMLYLGDVTAEAHVRAMAEQGGSVGVLSADARHVIDGILGRYRKDEKTDDSVYLRAHGGDTIDRARVGTGASGEYVRIPRPQVGMALAIQPDKLDELGRRPELLSSGFLPRCNMFAAPTRVGTRIETGSEQSVAVSLREEWDNCVRRLIDHRQAHMAAEIGDDVEPITLVLDQEAQELRRNFANEIERRQAPGGDLEGAKAFASKVAGEAARLAALFHLAELSSTQQLSGAATIPIPARTWRCAEAHQRWQLAETLRVVSLAREDQLMRLARRTLGWAQREPTKRREISCRDLLSAHIAKDNREGTEVMALLVDFGWARLTKTQKPPAPGRERWELNPLVFGGAA